MKGLAAVALVALLAIAPAYAQTCSIARELKKDAQLAAWVQGLESSALLEAMGGDFPSDATIFVPAGAVDVSSMSFDHAASLALVHIIPSGAFSIEELLADEAIISALPGTLLHFTAGPQSVVEVRSAPGGVASVVVSSRTVCGTAVHVVDTPVQASVASRAEHEEAWRSMLGVAPAPSKEA